MLNRKSYDEMCQMSPDEIRAEMLQIWHDIDFNNMTEEESEDAIELLRLYKEVYTTKQYYNRYDLS